jgi:hypothetical protein
MTMELIIIFLREEEADLHRGLRGSQGFSPRRSPLQYKPNLPGWIPPFVQTQAIRRRKSHDETIYEVTFLRCLTMSREYQPGSYNDLA